MRERKSESVRQNRRASIDMSNGGERDVQSSPVRGSSARDERRPSTGSKGTASMKQVEEVNCTFWSDMAS